MYGVEGVAEGECVEILLSSALKSLAYLPETLLDSRGVIDFYNLFTTKDAFIISAPAVAKYRVNPSNADVTGVEWSVLTRGVETRAITVPTIAVKSFVPGTKGKQGYIDFTLVAEGKLPTYCDSDAVADADQVLASLVATTPEGEVIVSDEAYAQEKALNQYWIINHDAYYKNDKTNHYAHTAPVDANGKVVEGDADFHLVYNSTINIIDSLETYLPQIDKALPEINVVPTYSVSLAPVKVLGADGKTDQQKFVNLTEDGDLTVNTEWLANSGRAAIGRTPVVKVYSYVKDANDKNVVVDSAYVKIEIVDETFDQPDMPEQTYITVSGEYEYAEIGYEWKDGKLVAKAPVTDCPAEILAITWEDANAKILDVLGLSYEQFIDHYKVNDVKYEKQTWLEVDAAGMNDHTATNFVEISINCLVPEEITDTVKVVIPVKDEYKKVYGDVAVEFYYTVSHDHVWPEFNPDYLLAGETVNTVQVKGKKIGATWSMTSEITEHFKEYKYAEMDEHHNPIEFTLPLLDKNGVPTEDATVGTPQKGATIGMVEIDGEEVLAIYLTDPLEVESKDYVVKMTETLHNKNKCVQYYEVRFVSPFVVSLNDVTLRTLIANPDVVNLHSALSVVDTANDTIVKFNKTSNELELTEIAKSVYGLADVPKVAYKLDFAETGNDTEASFGKNLKIVGTHLIWDNDGTDLQNNKVAGFTATVEFKKICKLTEEADVTVLSTANSKGNGANYPTPNGMQWKYSVDGMDFVLDMGATVEGALIQAQYLPVYNEDYTDITGYAWQYYPNAKITGYRVSPTSKTSGVITWTQTRTDWMGEIMGQDSYIIYYSELTEDSVKLLSYNHNDESGYWGIDIANYAADDAGYANPIPVKATASEYELTEAASAIGW